MLRTDGKWVFYRIQHKSESGWAYSSFDYFGYPRDWRSTHGFSACGDCWQQTGVHGTFDKKVAIAGVKELSLTHADTKFRLVKVEITQETTEVSYAKITN